MCWCDNIPVYSVGGLICCVVFCYFLTGDVMKLCYLQYHNSRLIFLGGKELPPSLGWVLGSRGNIVRIGSQPWPPKPRVWDKVHNP